MNPIMLQKQLKENAADLDEFYKELKQWGEENKKKESMSNNANTVATEQRKPIQKCVSKKNTNTVKERPKTKTKIGYTDYSAWDKFDVDAECEKIDYNENEESDLSDECDEAMRDQAYLHKEKGNNFVKEKKWTEAIECYNSAINCYSYDPVFYANRALCFLKNEDYVKAELDCTMSLKLDSSYVKAFQRRAAAREALGKLSEAEADLLKVLEFEPKNNESKNNLKTLRSKLQDQKTSVVGQRPVSKFTASRNKKRSEIKSDISKVSYPEKSDSLQNIIPVKAVTKPIHLQSKKPLKRIEITETTGFEKIRIKEQPHVPKINLTSLKTDDLQVIERKAPPTVVTNETKENKNEINNIMSKIQFNPPVNSVQFYRQWKILKTVESKYSYFKTIKPENLPIVFKECMESNVFSEILEMLVKGCSNSNEDVFDYLKFFPEMRRFSTLMLFMSDTDKNHIRKLFDYVSQSGSRCQEEIDEVLSKYEL